MKYNKKRGGKTPLIHWHPAFVEAIRLELDEYRGKLEFHEEFRLSKEPLKIDCVIIKKAKDLVIKKNIAAIFRDVNLVEYKSPVDTVSITDFYKVYGYACIYASFENNPITNMTISFVLSRNPVKLLRHLKKIRSYIVEETIPGIYNVIGDILPIQIIDSSRLPDDENLWLKSLRKRLDSRTVIHLSNEIARQGKTACIQTYIDVISRANVHAIREAIKMSNELLILGRKIEKTRAKWEAKAKEKEALAIAQNMVNLGLPLETVVSATRLNAEKVKRMYPST